MKTTISPSTSRRYPLRMICQVWHVARSSVYAATLPVPAGLAPGKRGPKTRVSAADLVAAIRGILRETPFHGEGYRKVRARLAHRGLAVGGKRVLRVMRQHQLLAPRRLGPPNGDPAHAGTIITTRPDEMWGTDATRFYTDVIPSHFTSLIQASAIYCGPQSHRIFSPRAMSLPNPWKA